MVAGEASGDLLASLLIAGLRERWPDLNNSLLSRGIGDGAAANVGSRSAPPIPPPTASFCPELCVVGACGRSGRELG